MIKTASGFAGGFILGIIIIWSWNTYADRSQTQDIAGTTTVPENLVAVGSAEQNDITSFLQSNPDATYEDYLQSFNQIDSDTQSSNASNVIVTNQPYGSAVKVNAVSLESDGWIVVHEEKDGLITNALGAARRDSGLQKNIVIPLLRDTTQGARYWIVLYADNGDRQFDLKTDFPLRDSTNNPITTSFKAQ